MFSSDKVLAFFSCATKPAEETKSAEFWEKITNTPHSYELFDTRAEEISAREKSGLESKIETKSSQDCSYFLYGCHGDLTTQQFEVAKRMKSFLETKGYTKETKEAQAKFEFKNSLPERAISSNNQVMPKFAIVTGDNLYKSGAKSPNDDIFKRCFHDVYSKLLIYFTVLGNHDCNLDWSSNPLVIYGIQRAANEIAHTYLNSDGQFDQSKYDYLNQPYINLERLLEEKYHWFLPSRFYDITYKGNTFLMLDSNHFAVDYLKYREICTNIKKTLEEINTESKKISSTTDAKIETEVNQKINILKTEITSLSKRLKNNQAYWLEQAFVRKPNTRKILVWHHPVYTPGKRSEKIDSLHYLSSAQLLELKENGITVDKDYGTILKDILTQLTIPRTNETIENKILESMNPAATKRESILSHIDAIHCAHEHFKLIYNDKTAENDTSIFQVISGGGGSINKEKNLRKSDKMRNIPVHTEYGFDLVTLSNTPAFSIIVELFNIYGEYWCFDNRSTTPSFNWKNFKPENEIEAYKQIRLLLLDACYQYFDFRATPATSFFSPHGEKGLSRAIHLINTLNNPLPRDLSSLLQLITSYPEDSKLMSFINEQIQDIIGVMLSANISIPAALQVYLIQEDEMTESNELDLNNEQVLLTFYGKNKPS